MPVPKTGALPLGYAPAEAAPKGRAASDRSYSGGSVKEKPRRAGPHNFSIRRCSAGRAQDRHSPFAASASFRRSRSSRRSEEHTSELQSLMRISYAVFCLKKKKNNQKHYTIRKNNEH